MSGRSKRARKQSGSASKSHSTAKRTIQNIPPTPVSTNSREEQPQTLSQVDVSSLTQQITDKITSQLTETITKNVIDNLSAAGLFIPQTSGSVSHPVTPIVQATSDANSSVTLTVPNQTCDDDVASPSTSSGTIPTLIPTYTSSASSTSVEIIGDSSAKESGFTKRNFIFTSVPMHLRVPQKTKEKIWSGDFVELSTLVDEEVDDITINIKSGKISTKPVVRRRFMNIEQWTDAFNLYASVYRIKFPDEADQFSTYMNRVRRIASERGAWFYYDKNFRQIRKEANLRRDDIETDLYYTALNRKSPANQLPFRTQRGSGQSRNPSQLPQTPAISIKKGNNVQVADTLPSVSIAEGHTQCTDAGNCTAADTLTIQTNNNSPNMGRLRPQIPAVIQVVPTPVQWAPLSRYLDGYDEQEKSYIITGFQDGFKIDFIGQQNSQVSPNLKTALEHPEIVTEKIEKERGAGRIAGPFKHCLVEKKQAG